MNAKTKKVLNIVLNVLIVLIAIITIFVVINAIGSKSKGYTTIFGKTVYAVKSNSMEGDKVDSFNKGDLIIVKELSLEEKKTLKVGDVITFWTKDINGKDELNTHRIVSINNNSIISYNTKGDHPNAGLDNPVVWSDVIGVYQSKIGGLGNFILFVQSPTGFLILIVLPSFLILAYCVYIFVKNYKAYQLTKHPERVAAINETEKETMRKEILAELEREKEKKDEETKK